MKKYQQSVADFLFQYLTDPKLDETNEIVNSVDKKYVNPKAANALYDVWKNSGNRISNKTFKVPDSISRIEVNQMVDEGLIRSYGDTVEVTVAGSDIIKIMILGNDKSIFESPDSIDYVTAKNNINSKRKKVGESNIDWWARFDGVF